MKHILLFLSMLIGVHCFGQSNSNSIQVTNNIFIPKEFGLGPDYSKTIYPKNDLTYNQYVGETIAGYHLADGWREDSINGGFNKKVYWNPYANLDYNRFQLQQYNETGVYFYYKLGRKFTGLVKEEYISPYTKQKIIFKAECIKGLLQGKGVLLDKKTGKIIAECEFTNGRMKIL